MIKEEFVKSMVEQEQFYVNVRCFLNEFEANGVSFFLLVKEILEDQQDVPNKAKALLENFCKSISY